MRNRQAFFLGVTLFLSCLNFLYVGWFYSSYMYLPPPFIFDKANTFMDFYNTLYWSGRDGIYSVWNSVYPPLNFQLLQVYQLIFMDDISRIGDGFEIRKQTGTAILPLIGVYVASLLIAVRISFKVVVDAKKQLIIFLIFLLSPAFLFALERGNLIIFSIPILSWYVFSKSQIGKALALAVLVNMKPYFVIFYIVQLLNARTHRENKDLLFLAPVFSIIIFLVTGLLLNQEFYLIIENLLGFASNSALLSPGEVLAFPSSIGAFAYFRGLVTELAISPIVGYLAKFLIFVYLTKSLLLIYKLRVGFDDISIFTIIFITNYSISTGGYGVLYYIPILALLYKQKNYALLTLITASMYVGIWDLIPIYGHAIGDMEVYLSDKKVNIESFISLGSIIRPAANFAVLFIFYKNLEKRYFYENI